VSEPLVLVTTDDGVSTVTLNRPQKLNAINTDLAVALRDALDGLRDATRVVILTGAGDRAFVSGADVREMRGLDPAAARRFIETVHAMCWAALSHPQPVIAAINGYCLGAGLELAMSCDIRIAADHAQFGMPEIRLGVPSVIEAARMPDLISGAWTGELLFTGDTIDAHRAAHIGLITRVVPGDRLQREALSLARQLASYSPVALRLQKELIRAWRDHDLPKSIQLGVEALAKCFESGHPNEGMAAFLERRPAKYQ